MKDRNYRWPWLILVISALIRVGVALYLGDVVDAPPLLTDQRSYHALGVRLLEGHGYSFDRDWYPFTPANTPTAHWSFLYPLFVAAIYAMFGVHPLAVRLVQGVLGGVLLPWMVYRLARQIMSGPSPSPPSPSPFTGPPLAMNRQAKPKPAEAGYAQGDLSPFGLSARRFIIGRSLAATPGGRREAHAIPLIAAAIAAGYGYFILYATTLMTETFYIVALLWSLEVGLKVGRRLRDGKEIPVTLSLQLGLSLGLAALLRQSILPWMPVLSLWLFWQARRGKHLIPAAQTLAVVGFVLLACILPWTYRNYQVYGQFLLLNSNAGYAMFSAQHPMHGVNFREFDAAPLPEGWWGRSEPELDRGLMRLGIQFILDDPVRYFLLSLSRVRAFFEFWPTPDTTLLHNIGRSSSFGLSFPFMLYGLYLATRNSQLVTRNSLIFLFAAFYTLLHVLTWAMVRYRLAVDGVLIVLAALALLDLYTRGRRWLSARSMAAVPIHSYAAGSPQGTGSTPEE